MSAINDALNVMHKAEGFTKSVEGSSPSRFAPKPSGQHADAPYKMAAPAAPAKPAPGLGDELGSKARNVKEYEDATK